MLGVVGALILLAIIGALVVGALSNDDEDTPSVASTQTTAPDFATTTTDGARPGDSALTTPTTSGGGGGSGSINVFDLEVGDCFDVPSDGNITDVEGIPCDEPHDNEVFATFDIAGGPDAPFPGEDAVRQEAESQCAGALFTDYVGVSYNESVFNATSINPTQETWEQVDDREVICVAQSPDDSPLTSSVQGANR